MRHGWLTVWAKADEAGIYEAEAASLKDAYNRFMWDETCKKL